jgi:lipopolysaccharide/colanic/teichoic acid biosynthesis glycosyltransferase
MVLGDMAIFLASLWASLALRYFALPSSEVYMEHVVAFFPLFILWLCLYVIGGLYDRHLRFSKSKLPGKLWMAQTINVVIAFLYFYALQTSDIAAGLAPKTILALYLVISGVLITLWRVYVYPKFTENRPLRVLCIGSVTDTARFVESEVRLRASGIDLHVYTSLSDFELNKELNKDGAIQKIDVVVSNSFDANYKAVSQIVYDLMFDGVTYMDLSDFYEAIDESWFLKHVSVTRRFVYDFLKRIMDIIVALPLAILSIVWYPIVYIAIKLEDRGPIFIFQNRVGENGKIVKIIKFRSMSVSDEGKWVTKNDNRITKVGKIIRKTRIDELPQLINVLFGDLSLIGPRPELPTLVDLYKKEIPHYHVRHLIKPGLSGWAQIHHDVPPHSIEETKVKLSYDLYYIKNRGLMLDLKIAFATIKTLLSRTGI